MLKIRLVSLIILALALVTGMAAVGDSYVSAEGESVGNASLNISLVISQQSYGGGGDPGFAATSSRTQFMVEYWDVPKSALMQWGQDSDGTLLQDVEATSLDGMVTVRIPKGTKVLDADNEPLSAIYVTLLYPLSEESAPDPPEGYDLVATFDFEPDGTTFPDSGIEITLAYDPENMAEGEIPVIAFYNEGIGEWEFIPGIAGPGENEVTFTTDHFTVFAVLTQVYKLPKDALPVPISSSPSNMWWIVLAAVLSIPLLWGINLLGIWLYKRKIA